MRRYTNAMAALLVITSALADPAFAQDAKPAAPPAPSATAPPPSPAATPPATAATPKLSREEELNAALQAAFKAAKPGPVTVQLGEQGKIDLPAGYQYIPIPEAQRLMRAFGNRTGATFQGLVLSATDESWLTVIDFKATGYVKDDDAKDWKADELLQQLKDGTEEANADRVQRGFPELEVAGWVERPAYDATTHRLVWSVLARNKGAPAGGNDSVNYNTYALGREGFYQLNLITGSQQIEAQKKHAKTLLSALTYEAGKRYEDFNPSTDKIAEYGLAALIAGAAAKKLGLLAVAGAFFLKFAKIFVIGFAGLAALFAKFFRRR